MSCNNCTSVIMIATYLFVCTLGTIIRIERISPEVIFLRPPEKLVIEVRVSGGYDTLLWTKRSTDSFIVIPNRILPEEFPGFYMLFVRDNTTADDEGYYGVNPQVGSNKVQTHTYRPTGGLRFEVTAPSKIYFLCMYV